jgi:flavin reductase (DIM6/NTAB) family NADH-FMN oxidoreductase RutF
VNVLLRFYLQNRIMIRIDPYQIPHPKVHQILLGSVAPRPIAFASTIDKEGRPNLSPFSFYNAFGYNPTTLIFSPSRRGRDNTVKNTYENLKEVPEVVINAVNYSLVQQASLASTEYPKGVNEFIKAGLTPIPSEKIRPFRVKESPVQFECRVRQIIETGDQGGAANLIICEILLIHLDESILDEKGTIDLNKIDLVGRMGGDHYVRASGDAIFTVEKPLQKLGIGIDALPDKIKHSPYLSGNDLGQLGNLETLPAEPEIIEFNSADYKGRFKDEKELANEARKLLAKNKVAEALKLLMGTL